ncbi:MAG: hypothetical protein PHC28_16005, partial [Flavobacterium sp.]|nr:hypothetical protein [Flavobacterium sp.]
MKLLPKLLFFVFTLSIISCVSKKEVGSQQLTTDVKTPFKFGVWITADAKRSNESYSKEFKKYKDGGIDEVLINTNADPELLKKLVPVATKEGLKVHTWIMTM